MTSQRVELNKVRDVLSKAMATRQSGERYPEALKQQGIWYASQRKLEGIGVRRAAVELGMNCWVLRAWIRSARDTRKAAIPSNSRERFVPVAIVRAKDDSVKSESRWMVHGPCGIRVEEMSIDALATLIRKLS